MCRKQKCLKAQGSKPLAMSNQSYRCCRGSLTSFRVDEEKQAVQPVTGGNLSGAALSRHLILVVDRYVICPPVWMSNCSLGTSFP